jgi:hypothetical protein
MNEIVKANGNDTYVSDLDSLQRTASLLSASGFFGAGGNREESIAKIAVQIMAGKEMGYGPFTSVQNIHIIKGKPTLAANLMAAAVKGSTKYDYRIKKMENDVVSIEFFESGKSIGVSTFTTADAKSAGLTGDNWKKFSRNMLFARAMSNGVRWYCPDVFNGNSVYTPDELDTAEYTVLSQDDALPTNLDDVEAIEIPSNGNASKRFHVVGTETFGKDWDIARPWLIERYSTKTTPDNVRTSSKDLSDDELSTIADAVVKNKRTYLDKWFENMAAAANGNGSESPQTKPEIEPMPFN